MCTEILNLSKRYTEHNSSDEDEEVGDGNLETKRTKHMKEILEIIKNGNLHLMRTIASIEVVKLYSELCYPVIVGKQQWKVNHMHIGINTLLTVADEAIIALVIENNIKEWMLVGNGGEIDSKKRLTLYTHGGVDAKGTRKGWSLDGRLRYNFLHQEFKKMRGHDDADSIDAKLKELWKEEGSGKRNNRINDSNTDRNMAQLEENFEPVFDFDD